MAPQARYWLLTINDSDDGISWVPPADLNSECWQHVQWLRGQKEVGTGTGRPHWQLFCAFKAKKRLAFVRECFGTRVHAEPSRSSAAEDYVFKDETAIEGTRFELGQCAFKRNSATDWNKVTQLAKNGQIRSIIDEFPDIAIRYYGALKAMAKDFMGRPPDLLTTCGIWIYGPPGVGKSFFARQQYGELYEKPCNKWWDGYQGEKCVLLDDFDKHHKGLGHHLKIWADRYAFIGEAKGSGIRIRPEKIIITSNYKISEIFGEDEVLCEAIERRFYKIFIPMRRG